MPDSYFLRVSRETPTRFWINNPTNDELEQALAAGAICCTTNPTYCAYLIKNEPDFMWGIIDQVVRETPDDNIAADLAQQRAAARLMARLMPLYEQSGGTQGFVTIQSDPRLDEDTGPLLEAALRYRALGPNFMAKIPVTREGLEVMEALFEELVPVCATEVFSVDQAVSVCHLYECIAQRTGKRPPFYVTHITGIFDEYLTQQVQRDGIDISPETLRLAGCTVARKEYRWLKEQGDPGTMLGGGARSTRHFTDFVGGDAHVTINWPTAQELIDGDEPVVERMDTETPAVVVQELCEKLPDFRSAYVNESMAAVEFADYGPVQYFRDKFIAGYERLVEEIGVRRTSDGRRPPAP